MKRRNNSCPDCGTPAAPPLRYLFHPLLPLSLATWQCPKCFPPLRIQLAPYIVINLIACIPVIIGGFAIELMPDSIAVGLTAGALYMGCWAWLVITFTPIEIDNTSARDL